jgi:sialic acid synthase SpsE
MYSRAEIETRRQIYSNIADGLKFLYCISKYPTDPKEVDFATMKKLDGFSDHTLGIDCAKKAIDMGVEWIEKHFTLCRDFEGKDHFISIDAPQLRELCEYRDYVNACENYKRRWTEPLPPSCSDILCD